MHDDQKIVVLGLRFIYLVQDWSFLRLGSHLFPCCTQAIAVVTPEVKLQSSKDLLLC